MKNKYALTMIVMVIWLFTLENTNVFKLYEYRSKVKSYQEEIDLYQEKIQQTKSSIEELKDPQALERFAREEYFMKKDNEDIFVYHTGS